MDFKQAQEEYTRLKTRYQQQQISLPEFEKAAYNLSVVDGSGVEWQIGPATGTWYRFMGGAWVEGIPDITAAAPASSGPLPGGIPRSVQLVLGAFLLLLLLVAGAAYAMLSRTGNPSISTDPTAATSLSALPATEAPAVVEGGAGSEPVPGSEALGTDTPSADLTIPPGATAAEPPGPVPVASLTAGPGTSLPPATSPSSNGTPIPTIAGDLVAIHNWHSISRSDFDQDLGVKDEWRFLFDISSSYTFTNYSGLQGLHVVMNANYVEITPPDAALVDSLKNMEMEEVFAFPPANDVSSVNLVCRMQDLTNYYALVVRRTTWRLIRKANDVDTELATGATPPEFQNGAWGRVRLRCENDQVKAWFNNGEIASRTAQDYSTGSWGVLLIIEDENALIYDLYYQSHRVWEWDDSHRPGLYGAEEAGNVLITYERELVEVENSDRLGLVMINRSGAPLAIAANQVYLERIDGRKFPASAGSAETGIASFPYTLQPGRSDVDIAFADVTQSDVTAGLTLVIDLSTSGLGQMRFHISGQ